MGKMTLADLRKLRESSKKAMEMRDNSNKDAQVIVAALLPARRRHLTRSSNS